jgi:hypothetical protein
MRGDCLASFGAGFNTEQADASKILKLLRSFDCRQMPASAPLFSAFNLG